MRFGCHYQVATTSRDGRVVVFDINAGSMPSCLVSEIEARTKPLQWRHFGDVSKNASPTGIKGQPQLNPGLYAFDFPKRTSKVFCVWRMLRLATQSAKLFGASRMQKAAVWLLQFSKSQRRMYFFLCLKMQRFEYRGFFSDISVCIVFFLYSVAKSCIDEVAGKFCTRFIPKNHQDVALFDLRWKRWTAICRWWLLCEEMGHPDTCQWPWARHVLLLLHFWLVSCRRIFDNWEGAFVAVLFVHWRHSLGFPSKSVAPLLFCSANLLFCKPCIIFF